MTEIMETQALSANDFASDNEVRWCPGCGDYAILKAVKKTLAEIGAARENTVFISGIGCASRFPHYVKSYGFHSIHGRAPAIATGAMLANPELDMWIITGDGDGLSIGGNHLMHILRRNVNCQILMFNNEIYGLTKGQYSPTSHRATRSPSSPAGSLDTPVDPAVFALGCGAKFVARAVDTQQQQLNEILKAAYEHSGASFIEIYQNCPVFNDDVFSSFTQKSSRDDTQIQLEHGKPLVYGGEHKKGLVINPSQFDLEPVSIDEAGVTPENLITHDQGNRNLAFMLAQMGGDDTPTATGILYNVTAPTYEQEVGAQITGITSEAEQDSQPVRKSINDVLRQGFNWEV